MGIGDSCSISVESLFRHLIQPTLNAKLGVAGIAAFIWWLVLLLLD